MMKFERWRPTLGWADQRSSGPDTNEPVRLAAHVEWAAKLVPFSSKCLPRAMALSWMLRKRRIGHALVFAVRPNEMRGSPDDLHAWVEVAGKIAIGYAPGPWVETLRLGS
jgi:hypothetical protein